jgi:hypothetical protein
LSTASAHGTSGGPIRVTKTRGIVRDKRWCAQGNYPARARVCFLNGNEFRNSGGEVDSTCTFPNRGDPIALGGDASGVVESEVFMMSCDVRLSSSSQVLFRSSPPKKLSFLDFPEIFRRTFLTPPPPRAHRGGGFGGRRLPGPRTGVPHVFRPPHSLARQISRFSGFSGFLNFQIFGVF